MVVVALVIAAVGCAELGDEHTTASLQSERRVAEPSDDASESPLGDHFDPDDLAAGMGELFGGTTATTVPTGSSAPSDEAVAQLRVAVDATLAEPSVRSVVRQDMMGMEPEIDSVSSLSGDRSESVMEMGFGLSNYYRFIDGTVYVRQEGADGEFFGVELDKWANQRGDPAMLRKQMEGMTGVGVLRQLPAATDVGPADPAHTPQGWDVDELLAFALISQDLMGGAVRSSGLVGIRDGHIAEIELVGDTELYIAGRSSDQWMPFEIHVSFLEFGTSLDQITVPPPEEMAN